MVVTQSVGSRRLQAIVATVIVQTLAATFFLGDAVLDIVARAKTASASYHAFELLVAIGLVAGVIMGVLVLRRMMAEAKQRERTMALARGAMAELVKQRFAEWGLTDGEGEVALFAIKGFDISEIAALRNAAEGTVRAQLSRIYAKAGVTSHAMLVGGFIDEFLDVALVADADPKMRGQ